MTARRTRILGADLVTEYATLPAVLRSVEAAFASYAAGSAHMPPKSYIDLPEYDGDFRSMPSYVDVRSVEVSDRDWHSTAGDIDLDWDAAGLKWVNVHPHNRERYELPTVLGTYVYSDPRNGYPLAVMDGRELTRRRTGAAAAIATDRLAPPEAASLGIVGAGAQAETQLESVAIVRDLDTVVVHDRNPDRVNEFVDRYSDRFEVRGGSITEAGHCDILSTITPVESPIVALGDIGERTHVNAIGADAPGKHELSDELLQAATIVVDDIEQCTHSGEINVPWAAGVLTDADLAGSLGEFVLGEHSRPTNGPTVFDSTGLAIQDVAAAHVAYTNADAAAAGAVLDLLGV